ncbi:MAG: DNA polymerase III subunit delta [Candidatus Microthrix sp.]|jgi:DNA polymerase-3 subunit delta|uniref:DNA polymerase III subunit delta n=1 Tax=Candidatus Neomicrothrix subdominans TaxID=2954438 RepID=A0A936NE43_9ACTN|nr:DNA polymerase III subunit delta [Candidatus Microthrix sp.]MBK9298653.1 DNA polymerase III subunit delta [Candidatus Microthrix subdominans]MBP7595483.1 DNA polymerase III subunit delta [Candidatus Microthrix sp.]
MTTTPPPVWLVRGDDTVLVEDAVTKLVDRLIGDDNRSETLDVFSGTDYELGAVVMAAETPSMFGRRVLVAREAGRFGTNEDVAELLRYLDSPSDQSVIVIAWERPAVAGSRLATTPRKLLSAVKAAGGLLETKAPGGGKARSQWVGERLADLPVRLTPKAKSLVQSTFGEDLGRLVGLGQTLRGVFGEGALVDEADLVPYLGEAGSVPPWDLTDAIDARKSNVAVENLNRMIQGGDRHPLQIMASLTTHYQRIAALSGADVRTERDAADLLGIKGSTFPAKKALTQSRRLGPDGVARAIALLARADVDLRGASGLEPQTVIQVLVARLSRLGR